MTRESIRSPLGGLLDEIREEMVAASSARPSPLPLPSGAPEPDLRLEAGVVSGASGRVGGNRPWRWATALAIHLAALGAVVVTPLMRSDDLPAPVAGTNVLFVQPALAPPPPPAAPALPRAATPRERRKAAEAAHVERAAAVIAPVARTEDPIDGGPPAPQAPAIEDGVPGGVEEGVPGGIVGGVLEPRPADPEPGAPVRVGGAVREPRRIKNVPPVYPDIAARSNVEGVVLLEVTIRPDGHVDDVRVLRSIPLLDAAAMAAARQWVFTPTLVGGVPMRVSMTVSVRFSLTQRASAS